MHSNVDRYFMGPNLRQTVVELRGAALVAISFKSNASDNRATHQELVKSPASSESLSTISEAFLR